MTARSIRRAQERKAKKLARKAERNLVERPFEAAMAAFEPASEAAERLCFEPDPVSPSSISEAQLIANPAEYQRHIDAYEKEFQPVGQRESDLVQSIADTQWRLLRIPSLESGIYALGHLEFASALEEHDESLHSGLIEVKTFLKYERQLRNLHIQESRLQRRREKDIAELRQLQETRKADEEQNVGQALSPVRSHPARPAQNGFVFSTEHLPQAPLPVSPCESSSAPVLPPQARAA